ncbi:MAG: sulfotransferase [Pseudomonadota bacterium]
MRRLHLVNLSLPKTGTKSIAGLFANFRARHEYQFEAATKILEAYHHRRVERTDLSAFLLTRDTLGHLEVDSASVNFWFADLFVELFPQARFLVVLREPYAWLESVLAHLQRDVVEMKAHGLPYPASFRRLADVSGINFDPRSAESPDDFRGTMPFLSRQMLEFWCEQNTRLMRVVPPHRRLVLQTDDLSRSHNALSRFVGVKTEMLDVEAGHLHRRPDKSTLLAPCVRDSIEDALGSRPSHLWSEIKRLVVTDISAAGTSDAAQSGENTQQGVVSQSRV